MELVAKGGGDVMDAIINQHHIINIVTNIITDDFHPFSSIIDEVRPPPNCN
jgi:hypothetical protein